MTDAQLMGLVILGTIVFLTVPLGIGYWWNRHWTARSLPAAGTAHDTRYRNIGEGSGLWETLVEYRDRAGTIHERWLVGRYTGAVRIIYDEHKPTRTRIIDGTAVDPRKPWMRRIVLVVVLCAWGAALAVGVALATGWWSPPSFEGGLVVREESLGPVDPAQPEASPAR